MNSPDEEQIETLLRRPPRPGAPAGLKEQLIRQARSTRPGPSVQPSVTARPRESWFPRWRPVLLPAAFTLVCAAVLVVQLVQAGNLKQEIRRLSASVAENTAKTESPDADRNRLSHETAAGLEPEIARLKDLVATLTAEVSQLERVRSENQELRTKLAAPSGATFSPEDTLALEQMKGAKERAMKIACVNNLKQLGLAVRIWASDNRDRSPMNILDMTNEMTTPKILFCPSDTAHEAAKSDFSSYNPANNLSYEYLAPGTGDRETTPNRVLFRCPIHNNVCLWDGSVQSLSAAFAATALVQHDGKLYFEPPPQP